MTIRQSVIKWDYIHLDICNEVDAAKRLSPYQKLLLDGYSEEDANWLLGLDQEEVA